MIQAKLDDGKDLYIIGFGYFTAFMVVLFRYANIPYRHQPQHQDDDDGEGRGGEGRTLHLKFGRSTTSRQMCRD
ncbi:BnaCnng78490D [Brassica napus]|uniref:BnaCnng78490D protein n=2 Tax=Brassica TaxID=3705 RepID=A0A078K1F9_BRANA|nr:BnaCnng78490D [Brassica napus]